MFATANIQALALAATGSIEVSGAWASTILSLLCTVNPAVALGPSVVEFLTAIDVLMLIASCCCAAVGDPLLLLASLL